MKLGVHQKVTVLSISGIILLGILLGVYFIRHETRILNEALNERANVLLSSLSASCEYPVLIRDRKTLGRLATNVLAQKDVVLCEIEDENGVLLYRAGIKEECHTREYAVGITTRRMIDQGEDLILGTTAGGEEEIGRIRLLVSLAGLHQRMRQVTTAIAGFGLAIIAVFSMATFLLLRVILSHPIAELVSGIERIARGELGYKVSVQRRDEIGRLAQAFNQMTEDLQRTTVSRDYVDNILGSMNDALAVVSPQGQIQTVNPALCDLLGYEEKELVGSSMDMVLSEHQTDILSAVEASGDVISLEKTFLAKDGRQIPVLLSASAMGDAEHGVQGVIYAAKDISERKRAEEQVKESLKEKEVLLKEIHHRVKNNLQVISSLLYLQSQNIRDPEVLEALKDSQNRVKSMALIHEKLYRSHDLAKIDFGEYIRNLTSFLAASYTGVAKTVTMKTDVNGIFLDINTAIPCGLVINELVSNSLKHAFLGGSNGEIRVGLHPENGNGAERLTLIVADTGVGLPKHIDYRHTESLGLQLVNTLVKQLDGTIELDDSQGTQFTITFARSKS